MALILTSRVPWRRRPSGVVVPNAASPLVAGATLYDHQLPGSLMARAGGIVFPHLSAGDLGIGMHAQSDAGDDTYWSDTSATHGNTITLAMWLRFVRDPGTPYLVFSKRADWSSADGFGLWTGYNGTDWVFSVNSTRAGMVSGTAVAGNTYHVVGTYDQQNVRLYVNGVQLGATALTAAIGTNASVLRFGMLKVSEIIVYAAQRWPRALTDGEVRALYDPSSRWSLYAPLISRTYFDMVGGGGGTTYNESIAVAADASLTHAHALTVSAALAMALDATMSPAGPLTAAAALGLDADAAVTKASSLTAGAALGVDADATIADVAVLAAASAMSLAADATLAKSTVVTAVEAIALTADATLSKAAALVAAISLALAADASLSATDGTNSTYDEALALSADASLTPTGALIASLVADYAADAGLSAATSATIGEAIGLDLAGALEHVTQAAVAESIALGLTAVLQLAATASGDVTYTILRVAAETLRSARAQNDALRSAHVTGETLQ